MDPDILRWCIEFIARQETVSDNLLTKILSGLPVVTERSSLQKELVIRAITGCISEGLITESILNSLEKMEELDRGDGIMVAASLKRAYCAAAVDCTTVYLEASSFKQGKYLEAVDRIWRGRFRGLESRQSELVTDELKGCRDEIEAALWDAHARVRLLARQTNALHLIDVYLNEVLTIVGPPFLEVVAQTQTKQPRLVSSVEVRAQNLGNLDSGGVDVVGVEELSSRANEGIEAKGEEQKKPHDAKNNQMEASGTGSGGSTYRGQSETDVMVLEREEAENAGDVGWLGDENLKEYQHNHGQSSSSICVELRAAKRKEFHGKMELPKCQHPTSRRQARRPAVINDIDDEELPIELPPRSKYDILPSPEFNKVIESLRASSLELQRVVRDPLPDALRIAEAVQSKIARNQVHHDLDTANTPNSGETVQNVGSHILKRSVHTHSSDQAVHNNVPRPSLMERNVTAHTYEWDDSVDGSPQRIRLDDPTRAATSPLNKLSRKRKGNWTGAEEEALLQGVREYGVGNWKLIWNAKQDVLALRSTVDLKDKWRNMQKYHRGSV
ncbi:putative telomeric repeat binding protein [Tripterygium wilfordii]|uniref:Putative telomeric repeat binding protein n=1 Tax=Tripterygium wilfordii TaxID=458696 RepID=A0A7J7DDL3_TRIWF|nr:uncharacterized protein LOC120002942 [Tripterygium wilfordii]XP_038707738.1 uncharacterized protein LOC120002942 [Tripterygium wilfordii]XP_038707739.1 uncharacterized protein LOC120002942 [Tripterygium wilfordii]KAF5744447.1 putative telomeric repeat binding protein [Tripterygium wilfordii]